MRGNVHCVFYTPSEHSRRFADVRLALYGRQGRADFTAQAKPAPVLSISVTEVNILGDDSVYLEGFVCTNEDRRAFHKCLAVFKPHAAEQEAA